MLTLSAKCVAMASIFFNKIILCIGRHSLEMQPPKPPEGRQLRYWKAPVPAEEKEASELESCRLLFNEAGT